MCACGSLTREESPCFNIRVCAWFADIGMHIDRHKYDEADTHLLLRTPIFEQAMKIYEREAPEFLAERGFPTDVRERHVVLGKSYGLT